MLLSACLWLFTPRHWAARDAPLYAARCCARAARFFFVCWYARKDNIASMPRLFSRAYFIFFIVADNEYNINAITTNKQNVRHMHRTAARRYDARSALAIAADCRFHAAILRCRHADYYLMPDAAARWAAYADAFCRLRHDAAMLLRVLLPIFWSPLMRQLLWRCQLFYALLRLSATLLLAGFAAERRLRFRARRCSADCDALLMLLMLMLAITMPCRFDMSLIRCRAIFSSLSFHATRFRWWWRCRAMPLLMPCWLRCLLRRRFSPQIFCCRFLLLFHISSLHFSGCHFFFCFAAIDFSRLMLDFLFDFIFAMIIAIYAYYDFYVDYWLRFDADISWFRLISSLPLMPMPQPPLLLSYFDFINISPCRFSWCFFRFLFWCYFRVASSFSPADAAYRRCWCWWCCHD